MPVGNRRGCPRMQRPWSGEGERSCPSVASYLDFYNNIPDYSDLHDLSDAEFYERLQTLKDTQQHFNLDEGESGLGMERPSSQSSFGSKPSEENKVQSRPASEAKVGRRRKKLSPSIVVHSPLGHCMSWEAKEGKISTCNTPPSYLHHHHQRDVCRSLGSLESSTLHIHGEQCLRPHSRASNRMAKNERKHEVPLLSRIPLFHKIMAEQEERRRIIHERNSHDLRAMVQPFSFTKKEEAAKQVRGTSINLAERPIGRSRTPFRAKPVPRDLFSDRAYDRIREDQFYRALRKRIRAEEMLKAAKMPPSMEAREKDSNKSKSKSLDSLTGDTDHRQRSHSRGYRCAHDAVAAEVEVSTSGWGRRQSAIHMRAGSNTDSSADASPNDSTLGPRRRDRPSSNLSASRSNLASVLRIQTARNRLEGMMKKQLEEQELQEQARFKARLLRLSPAWRTLDYNTDEDLALRLAQRRHEARQQGHNHRRIMEGIRGRVHHMPPLFQEPGRINCCGKNHLKKNDPRSKSLESCLRGRGKEGHHTQPYHSRKAKSFYFDNRVAQKSSESSQAKSDISKENSTASDTESNDDRIHPSDC